jgi:hypothetical protein
LITERYLNITLEPGFSPVMLVLAWIVGGIVSHVVPRQTALASFGNGHGPFG